MISSLGSSESAPVLFSESCSIETLDAMILGRSREAGHRSAAGAGNDALKRHLAEINAREEQKLQRRR